MSSYKAIVAAALFCGANAHILLQKPVPFAGGNNSPLEADGSNFPCKANGQYQIASMNEMPVGTDQALSFQGSAVHGGGSCQVSLTTDQNPTKDSKWKVVHSIIGGCPADTTGNLPANPDNTGGLGQFKFQIPKGVASGKYTLAWTWFNKIGNREMYMQCAPIDVTGGSDDKDYLNKLPDMFVANIPQGGTCKVPESFDIVFPNPGDSKESVGSGPFTTPAAPCGAGGSGGGAAAPTSAAGSGSSGSGSGASAPAASAPAASSAAPANSGGVFAPGAASGGGSAPSATSMVTVVQPTQAPAAPTAAAPAASSAAPAGGAASPAAPAGGASGSCSNGSVPCSNDGSVVCMDGGKWGLCDRGCAVPQLMAAGMACDGGVMKAAVGPGRVRRHANAHKRGVVPGDF